MSHHPNDGFGIKVEVKGRWAGFFRPELSVERVSYDFITPSAARGLIESVFWHPGLRYVIDRIHVLNPIRFTSIRRNEVNSKALASQMLAAAKGGKLPYLNRADSKETAQRAALVLTDVRYVIEAHFDVTDQAKPEDNPGKFKDMLRRRLEKGQCYAQPYLGVREFAAQVNCYRGVFPPKGFYSGERERDFGLVLYDMDYSDRENITPMFFRAVMRHGVIEVAGSEVFR